MKLINILTICASLLWAGTALATEEKEKTCCQKAVAEGKECSHPCCAKAHAKKESCGTCNPHGEDKPKEEKK